MRFQGLLGETLEVVTIIYYDLTSTYFEGQGRQNPQAQRGYSRDGRPDGKQVVVGDEVHILCKSDGREQKDRAIRAKHEERLLADLGKLKKRVATGKLKDAAKVHGGYLLKTDRKDLSDEELWRTYLLLTRVESAFRAMKSPLSERLIFHQLEQRVQTHIFLCVLAYHLLVAIEKMFQDAGIHTSWATLREELTTHQVVTVVLPASNGDMLKIRRASPPEPRHKEIYETLRIPMEVMKPVKTWVRAIVTE